MPQPNLLPAPIDAEPIEEMNFAKELEGLRGDLAKFKREWESDMQQMSALLRSGRVVFGNATPSTAPSSSSPVESDKWERLKIKLGGKMAEIIEALQLSDGSTTTQIRNQTGGALSTVKAALYKLRDMGMLVKNGDGWSLKP